MFYDKLPPPNPLIEPSVVNPDNLHLQFLFFGIVQLTKLNQGEHGLGVVIALNDCKLFWFWVVGVHVLPGTEMERSFEFMDSR